VGLKRGLTIRQVGQSVIFAIRIVGGQQHLLAGNYGGHFLRILKLVLFPLFCSLKLIK